MYPQYGELPLIPDSDNLRHAWDVFGPGDALGTLNHLTPARRSNAAALIERGEAINLSLPLTQPSPAPFGRRHPQHEVYSLNSFSWDDRLTGLDLQASTQWDGLLHVRHKEFGFYGGRLTDPAPNDPLGIDHWVAHGMVGRGVLLDIERHFTSLGEEFDPMSRRSVTAEELREVAAAQGVKIQPGDILCLRFGWHVGFGLLDQSARVDVMASPRGAGLCATGATAEFLWDAQISALACDNVTVEVQPGNREDGYLHHRLITMLGMPLGELFDFEELTAQCEQLGRWEFFFTSIPLNLPGAVGSPANALALL